jgi:hypothetical protein
MDQEIKFPELDKPQFFRMPYDYRNIETAGQYRGVGQAGKTASKGSGSINAMPSGSEKMQVPRDHKG